MVVLAIGGAGMWLLIGAGVVPTPHLDRSTGALHTHGGEDLLSMDEGGAVHDHSSHSHGGASASGVGGPGGRSLGDYLRLPALLSQEPSRIIYLNREGAHLVPGDEFAARNSSTIVRRAGVGIAEVPAFSGSQRTWRRIVSCVQRKFAPFDVVVTDRRPVRTDNFVMAVFGGTARLLGRSRKAAKGTGGLAPFNGESIPHATAFVFTSTLRNDVRQICETAAMEIAHTYGLDHAYYCKDIMTYRPRCGTRTFTDKDVRCGESKPRPCAGERKTQNAYQQLGTLLGFRKSRPGSKPRAKR